jgi:hypothetical protein
VSDKKHTTPAASIEIIQKQVADLQEYVAGTIRRRESARITDLESKLVQANQAILELEQQLTQVKNTFFSVTGRRAQTLPIVEVE